MKKITVVTAATVMFAFLVIAAFPLLSDAAAAVKGATNFYPIVAYSDVQVNHSEIQSPLPMSDNGIYTGLSLSITVPAAGVISAEVEAEQQTVLYGEEPGPDVCIHITCGLCTQTVCDPVNCYCDTYESGPWSPIEILNQRTLPLIVGKTPADCSGIHFLNPSFKVDAAGTYTYYLNVCGIPISPMPHTQHVNAEYYMGDRYMRLTWYPSQ